MVRVGFYFDFISPYAYLALSRARDFARRHGIRWRLRPVVYAKLLDATGLSGPAENDFKRPYMFADVLRCAHRLGLPLAGPPAHPFRSLHALRVQCLFDAEEGSLSLARALAGAAWAEGRDLCDWEVLLDAVQRCSPRTARDARELEQHATRPENKERLRAFTEEAIRAGVFGVPSFELAGELFWGHDRMEHLAEYLAGSLPGMRERSQELCRRPRGAERRT